MFCAAITLPIAVSCSDDNDIDNGVDGFVPIVNGKSLVKIMEGNNTTEFEYNTNYQVLKVKQKYEHGTTSEISFSYEPKRIIMNPYDKIYYLNKERITECKYTALPSNESTLAIDFKESYEYDNNGYLIKKTIPLDNISEEGYNTQSIVYKWHDGNIYKINHSDTNGDYVDEITISYTSYANTIPDVSQGLVGWTDSYLGWQGYFGKRCKNLPASETVTTFYNNETTTYHYEYTIEDGVVTKVSARWNYKGYPSTRVFVLEWY